MLLLGSGVPRTRVFASDAGMVLTFIKADKTADFGAVMATLREALRKSHTPGAETAGGKLESVQSGGARARSR